MSMVSEVVAACGSVREVLAKVEIVSEDWFTATEAYHRQAEILRVVLGHCEEQAGIHQQPADSSMMLILKTAEATLKTAEARLKILGDHMNSDGCCSPFRWFYAKISLIFLPEILQNTFKKVSEEIGRIAEVLKAEKENSALMQDGVDRRAISATVHNNDNKYVPIEPSQSQVIKAIEDIGGPRVILLHGGIGKGKSTLARYINERYASSPASSGEKKVLFNHVIMVSCGNTSISDLVTKQYEILGDYSPTSLTEKTNLKNVGSSSKARIESAFKHFFTLTKILMILDDVSDKDLLYKMWEAAKDGEDDKILVTSLLSNLCDDIKKESVLVPMVAPNQDEARKILASLVGLENQTIPTDLQGDADKIIHATDGNLLAFACLASNFASSPDKTDKRDWINAWTELPEQLDRKDTTIVIGRNGVSAPRSLWETYKRCIESLKCKDAIRILVVMYACKGESVPEAVLRILCGNLQMSSSTFKRARDELCMKELLNRSTDRLASKIIDLDKIETDKAVKSCLAPAWCLQMLAKLYIESHMAGEQEVTAVVGALLGNEDASHDSNMKSKLQPCDTEIVETRSEIVESDDRRVTIALCALYFNRGHMDQVVTRAVTKACQLSNLVDSDDDINDRRRTAIEPLIWLLDKPEEEGQWTETDKCFVRKVLLEYICKRQLDNENISYLLKLDACPSVQLATLEAICQILSMEEQRLLKEDTISFLHDVVDLLNSKEGVHTVVQEAASRAIRYVCWKAIEDESTALVANVAGLVDVLVQTFANPKSDKVAENVAKALFDLTYEADDDLKLRIVNEEGMLAGLVTFMSKTDPGDVQIAAAYLAYQIAAAADAKAILKGTESILEGLTSMVGDNVRQECFKVAAYALWRIDPSRARKLGLPSPGLDNRSLLRTLKTVMPSCVCDGEQYKSLPPWPPIKSNKGRTQEPFKG